LKAGATQAPQSFDTAVIRPTQTAANAGTNVELFPGGRIKIVNGNRLGRIVLDKTGLSGELRLQAGLVAG
jgi:hypothetical protein